MFVPFLYQLRARGVPVGSQEAVALAEALAKGLHNSSLDGFYHVARALLIHSEAHLDAFDEAFLACFRGVEGASLKLHEELLKWLEQARRRERELAPWERALLERYTPEELRKMFEERLRQQKERHDGGGHWIGTGGFSPFGHGGAAREGIRVGGPGGNRSAIHTADARAYRAYRNDLRIDVRQFSVALRKLRTMAREDGGEELDVEETIDATARNAGELEIVTRPPRRSNTRVILLMDVGGSMDPYTHRVEQLFTAAGGATHFREFRAYYFHNCIYGQVYATENFREPVTVEHLLHTCGKHYKLILVGDAMMAPYELLVPRGSFFLDMANRKSGLEWLMDLAGHFRRSVWLNPEEPRYWQGPGSTLEDIRRVFPMHPLTLEGLDEAIRHLVGGRRGQSFGLV
ncbi:MAG: VWA domain-containing protein [Armatimonadetes bacterium]|nr:VWA domain-containing protein [Armatimonadota bacterium]